MADPQTIIRDGTGAQTASYELPPGVWQYVQSVLVEVTNGAAVSVRPTLKIETVNGQVMATKRQGESIPAGDTGTATWALRLADEGGASTSGGVSVHRFPFTFNSPGLSSGAGFPVFVPTVGDIWLDAWLEIDTAFDGTTPQGDFAQLDFPASTFGMLFTEGTPADMTLPDGFATSSSPLNNNSTPTDAVISNAAAGARCRLLPGRFVNARPIGVWVTQGGTMNGGNPVSTQGAGALCIVVAALA